MNKPWDAIWINGSIATCTTGYGLINNAAIAVLNGKIIWLGKAHDLPSTAEDLATHIYDLQGSLLTPGLIDCHTHVIYGGNRALEFESRLAAPMKILRAKEVAYNQQSPKPEKHKQHLYFSKV
jgi:imidazolonepropionase